MTAKASSEWKVIALWIAMLVLAQVAANLGWFESGGWLSWLTEPAPFWLLLLVAWTLIRAVNPSYVTGPLRELAEDTSRRLEELNERVVAQQELLEELREDLGVSPNQKSYQLLCQELLGDVPSYEDYCNPNSAWNLAIKERLDAGRVHDS